MISPIDFHKTAEFLKDQQEEWHVRTVVNRSYYGVFLHFREFLAGQGVHIPGRREKKSQHQFIIECFKKSITKAQQKSKAPEKKDSTEDSVDYKIIGRLWSQLRTLFYNRIKADYHLDWKVPPNCSGDSLKQATTTIRDFANLRGSPTEKLIINVAAHHGDLIRRLAIESR